MPHRHTICHLSEAFSPLEEDRKHRNITGKTKEGMEPVKASRVIGLVYVALLLLVLGLLLAALGIDVRWLADVRRPGGTAVISQHNGSATDFIFFGNEHTIRLYFSV